MKSTLIRVIAVLMILLLFTGCGSSQTINGVDISQYTIVYSQDAPGYCQRAAEYIQSEVFSRTGVELPVCEASSGTYAHEILVGDTDRKISSDLAAHTENMTFAITAADGHIALNAEYYVIAAAAYYFVETYIPAKNFKSEISTEITLNTPITKAPNNFIFMIGDGMGFNHTRLFEEYNIAEHLADVTSDNEDIFYGYHFPYQGQAHTDSLSGTTDSAAGATALSTGYKTLNGYIGVDDQKNNLTSLTELAGSMEKATAVLTTDTITGATPAGFSAHYHNRNNKAGITESQKQLVKKYNTTLLGFLEYSEDIHADVAEVLDQLDQSEKGFFMMYEEAHIDKYADGVYVDDTDPLGVFSCVVRFNQAIGTVMEYAFYNPDTFVLITADHETGGLTDDFEFTTTNHTSADVPVFAYGQGAEVFDGFCDENTEIPKAIAKMWGVSDFGDNR